MTRVSQLYTSGVVNKIKNDYPKFLSCSSDMSDKAFIEFNKKIKIDFDLFLEQNSDIMMDEVIKNFCRDYAHELYEESFAIISIISYIYSN